MQAYGEDVMDAELLEVMRLSVDAYKIEQSLREAEKPRKQEEKKELKRPLVPAPAAAAAQAAQAAQAALGDRIEEYRKKLAQKFVRPLVILPFGMQAPLSHDQTWTPEVIEKMRAEGARFLPGVAASLSAVYQAACSSDAGGGYIVFTADHDRVKPEAIDVLSQYLLKRNGIPSLGADAQRLLSDPSRAFDYAESDRQMVTLLSKRESLITPLTYLATKFKISSFEDLMSNAVVAFLRAPVAGTNQVASASRLLNRIGSIVEKKS